MIVDLPALIRALHEKNVNFVIIGGAAATLHGSAYITEDLDILYERKPGNVARLVAALAPLHPRLRVAREPEGLPFLFDEKAILNGANFTLTTDLGDIDILSSIAGLGTYDNVSQYVDGLSVFPECPPTQVLSLEGLIRSKRAAGRTKDLLVLPELEAMLEIQKTEVD